VTVLGLQSPHEAGRDVGEGVDLVQRADERREKRAGRGSLAVATLIWASCIPAVLMNV
jgi:hypothetical protein